MAKLRKKYNSKTWFYEIRKIIHKRSEKFSKKIELIEKNQESGAEEFSE